jgi:lipopolysaccharide biosynthesis protein
LFPYLADRRYIRIDGRPLLLVYRADVMPDVRGTLARWREISRAAGIAELYLATVQSFYTREAADPRRQGFDAAVEFPPHGLADETAVPGRMLVDGFKGRFYDYAGTARNYLQRPLPRYKLFRTVMPAWDNTARRPMTSDIFANTAPELYEQWLREMVDQTRRLSFGDERTVFINAWNEWGEGNHLEPDLYHGRSWLEATQRALGLHEQPAGEEMTVAADRSA